MKELKERIVENIELPIDISKMSDDDILVLEQVLSGIMKSRNISMINGYITTTACLNFVEAYIEDEKMWAIDYFGSYLLPDNRLHDMVEKSLIANNITDYVQVLRHDYDDLLQRISKLESTIPKKK